MATRITDKGRVSIPREVRHALRLSAGDAVEFRVNGDGKVVLQKAAGVAPRPAAGRGRVTVPTRSRVDAQTRRRAAELLELLRRLD